MKKIVLLRHGESAWNRDVYKRQVLKDAAAASIYGALAANGIIVVVTKQAKEEGAHVNINADRFITSKPNFNSLNLASTSDIIDYQTAVFDANVALSLIHILYSVGQRPT